MIKQSVSRKRTTRKHRNPKRTTRKHRKPKRTTKKQRKPKRTTKKQRKAKRTTKKTQPKRQNKSKKVMKGGGGERYEVISNITHAYNDDEEDEDDGYSEEIQEGTIITDVKPYKPTKYVNRSEVLKALHDNDVVKFNKYGKYGPVVIKKGTPNLDIKKKLLKIISMCTKHHKEQEKKDQVIELYIKFRLSNRDIIYEYLVAFLMENYAPKINTSIHTKWIELRILITELKKEYTQLDTYEVLHIINDIIAQGIQMEKDKTTFKFFPELVALIDKHGDTYLKDIEDLRPGNKDAKEITDEVLLDIIMECAYKYGILDKQYDETMSIDKSLNTQEYMIKIMMLRHELYEYLKTKLMDEYSVSTLKPRLDTFGAQTRKEIIHKGIKIIKEILDQRTEMESEGNQFVFFSFLRTVITMDLEPKYRKITSQERPLQGLSKTELLEKINAVFIKLIKKYNTQEPSTREEFKKDVITNITGLNDIQIWEFINLFLDYNKDKYSTNKGWKDMYNMINPDHSEA